MTVVWPIGRESLHTLYHTDRDVLLWQTRGSSLPDLAPGSGLPTCREMRTQTVETRRTNSVRAERAAQRRLQAKAQGFCAKCYTRPVCARCKSLCRRCAERHASRARKNRGVSDFTVRVLGESVRVTARRSR